MAVQQSIYRKNFSLIISFLILISVTFIVALFIAYGLTSTYVENEFSSKKIDVLERTMKPYNDFFFNRIPEITYYQGYLDSTSAAKYSGTVFSDYPFVERIIFYDISVGSNKPAQKGLGVHINSMYEYWRRKDGTMVGEKKPIPESPADFTSMSAKLNNFIAFADTSREPTQDEKFRTFYDIQPEKITYLNIPRREEVKRYREIQKGVAQPSEYKQNMLTFILNQHAIKVVNTHPELYKNIYLRPVVYDPLDNSVNKITTEVPLTGGFPDYKLYFSSPLEYLTAETNRRFMPIAAMVLLIYAFLVLIGWLIYRNLNVNMKLFKLQYDFINNLTHEFKTPISVIKIAGSNLRGDGNLSERQLKHYGKILDEEADKLNELMTKLLSFTQLENKSISIKKEEVDLEDFTKGYIDTFSIKYPDFKLDYKIEKVSKFYTDPVLLGSIFQNLMENAYKYSNPKRREMSIKIAPGKKNNILFSFRDKGIGIAREEMENIFKKFYRIENQYNQDGSVGLGLAFCKELVNFMSGEITVSSKVNEGSEFIVTLPYVSAE
jgi:two-component system phosphate regulon sensor histidine kinase PhoR